MSFLTGVMRVMNGLSQDLQDLASRQNSVSSLKTVYTTDRSLSNKEVETTISMPTVFIERSVFKEIDSELKEAAKRDLKSLEYSENELTKRLETHGVDDIHIPDMITSIFLKFQEKYKHISVKVSKDAYGEHFYRLCF